MDITSPRLLKIKALLFVLLGLFAATLLVLPDFSWRSVLLLGLTIWAFCRAYYFCFYVLEHYADSNFKYSGLLDLARYLLNRRKS